MFQETVLYRIISKAVHKTARGIVRDFGEIENLQTSQNGCGDFVEKTVNRAHETLSRELSEVRPDFGLHSSITGQYIEGKDKESYWLYVPLDGLTNFENAIPHFAIMAALICKNTVIAALCYDPVKNEEFWFEQERSIACNQRTIRVSGSCDIANAYISCMDGNIAPQKRHHEVFLRSFMRLSPRVQHVHISGSSLLDLVYVAAGRLDATFSYSLPHTFLKPGFVFVQEAGGSITDWHARLFRHGSQHVLASNAALKNPLSQMLSPLIDNIEA